MNGKSKSMSIQSIAGELLERAGCKGHGTGIEITPIPYGGNNRAFKVSSEKSSFLLKSYFFHLEDQRDRLGTEFKFLSFLWDHGIQAVPQPILKDEYLRMGLYGFIEGENFDSALLTADKVDQAIAFVFEINHPRLRQKAHGLLSGASEACFSINDHLLCVESRLHALKQIPEVLDIDKRAQLFIKEKVFPIWEKIKGSIYSRAEGSNMDWEKKLTLAQRCLSPSDFGFHNVMVEHGGGLKFIDFEYAGWDDPAKMICDFFCQPKIPVPSEYMERFITSFSKHHPDPHFLCRRIHLLLPVFRLKWCTIIMNEFLKVGNERRRFSSGTVPENEKKQQQLRKAELYLRGVEYTLGAL